MAPTIKLGDLIFVRPQQTYRENDTVSFGGRRDSSQVTTHRLVQINEDIDLDTTTYTTKGDGNEDTDTGFVRKEQVIGKVVFKLPLLGFLVSIAKTQTGFILLVVIPATILVYGELVNLKTEFTDLLADREKGKKGKKKKPAQKKKKSTKKKKIIKSKKNEKVKKKNERSKK